MICLGHFIIFMTYLTKSQSEHVPVITQTPKDYYPRYGTLELSCHADGDPRPDISWYDDKTKQKVVNSIGIRGFDNAVQIMRTGQLSRIIITEPDSQQEYKVYCNASNNLGYTVSPPATMGLAYLNDKFQINPASEKEAFSGTVIELVCKPPEGRPEPKVTWFKNGQLLSATNNPLHTVTTKPEGRSHYSILKIINSNSEDSGNYHCLAENSFGSAKSTTSNIKIIRSIAHSNIVKDVQFRISTNAKIQCPTESFETVHWTRLDGNTIDTSRVSIERNNLRISEIQMSDSGRYLCRVTSVNGSPSEYIINVIVQAPATFAQTPEDKSVFEGDDVTFKCIVLGYPLPQVYWELPGLGVLFPDDTIYNRFRVDKDGSLTIENTQLGDAGKYTCNCHSSLDARHSSANLYVKKRELAFYPVISLPPQNQTLVEGSTATFRCEVVSHMEAIINWYKGPQNELLQPSERISIPTRGALQIKKIDPNRDTNIYICEAALKSHNMKTRWTAFLRVIYPDSGIPVITPLNDESQLSLPPVLDPPVEQTSNSITLSWSNSGQVKYWIEYVRFGSREGWVIYKKDWADTKITVKNLQPNSWYQFLVRSRNSKGLSRASVPTEYVKTLGKEVSRQTSNNDIKNQKLLSVFSQIQINIISLNPIMFGKVKLEWEFTKLDANDYNLIEGFRIRYNMIPLMRCLEDNNQAQIKKKHYCSFQGRNMDSIRNWIIQSDNLPRSSMANFHSNQTSRLIDFKSKVSQETSIIKRIITGLNPFSCYEFTVEAYSEIKSITSRESQPRNSLMLEEISSQPPLNIRTQWGKPQNTLVVHYYLPPRHTWNGFLNGFIVHIFANDSRSLLGSIKFNDTSKEVKISQLDEKKSYSLYMAFYNCRGEGVRSPGVYVSSRTDELTTFDRQPWFIPVIVIGTLIFWILLCCLVVYLCCIRFHLITKGQKLKSKDHEINLEPLMNAVIKDSVSRQNILCVKSQASNKYYSLDSEALYSATSIINATNHLKTECVSSGTCTPYATAIIVDSIDSQSDIGTMTKFYTGPNLDGLGPSPGTSLPPYLTFAPQYTPFSISSSSIPFQMPTTTVDSIMLSSSNNSNAINFNTQVFNNGKEDNCSNFAGGNMQNSKYFNPSTGQNNWLPAVKMGISQLPGSSSGTSSSGTTSKRRYIEPKSGSINTINCSVESIGPLGQTTPSSSAIGTDSGVLGLSCGKNKDLKCDEESPKSTVHYDVIPNQETCDEFGGYSTGGSSDESVTSNQQTKLAPLPIIIDTNNMGSCNDPPLQHSPEYSSDSVTYSAVPHRPYPKSNRKKQMRQYQANLAAMANNSAVLNKPKL